MKKTLSLILITIFGVFSAQKFNKNDYPKGVYKSFDDFIAKTPSSHQRLSEAYTKDTIAYRFNDMERKGKKLKKVFAVSDGKNVYIHIRGIIKKFDKKSKGQSYDGGKYFLKAQNKGGYLFVEDYFTSDGAAIFGGLIGSVAARRKKGIIYIEEDQKFHLFKNLKTFQEYMENTHPNITIDLKNKKGDKKKDESEIEASNLEKITL